MQKSNKKGSRDMAARDPTFPTNPDQSLKDDRSSSNGINWAADDVFFVSGRDVFCVFLDTGANGFTGFRDTGTEGFGSETTASTCAAPSTNPLSWDTISPIAEDC